MMDKTPATFDYREIGPHDTGDRRCSCGELTICETRHAALAAAAQHALDYTQPDGIECCQCCGQFDDEGHSEDCFVPALRAALDGEPFTHPRIGTQEGT